MEDRNFGILGALGFVLVLMAVIFGLAIFGNKNPTYREQDIAMVDARGIPVLDMQATQVNENKSHCQENTGKVVKR